MKVRYVIAAVIGATALGLGAGYTCSELEHQRLSSTARTQNYTDRARICLEAAALIRQGEVQPALRFLEARGLTAIRGIPMGRSYVELTSDSQALLVGAQKYVEAFPDVDLELSQLTRNDIPDKHPALGGSLHNLSAEDL